MYKKMYKKIIQKKSKFSFIMLSVLTGMTYIDVVYLLSSSAKYPYYQVHSSNFAVNIM